MDLQELLGISLPVIQAPMAGAQGSALAIAVSNAGGLESLPCGMSSPEAIRKDLAAMRAQTDKPFNVNFSCHVQPEVNADHETGWRKTLASFYVEFGIELSSTAAGPGHRSALMSRSTHHTALTNIFSGRPARGIVNRAMRELGPMNDEVRACSNAGWGSCPAPPSPSEGGANMEPPTQ